MADVQVEDGYTRVANVLLEKIASSKLNGCQNAIVLLVWRYTYGFNRKEHELSAGFLANATGYNKRQIERELSSLSSMNIITQKVINGVSRTLSFNKDYETWTPGKLADGEKADAKLTDGQNADTPPANTPEVTPGKLADQEIHSFKDNLKNNTTTDDDFVRVSKAYGRIHQRMDIEPKYMPLLTKLLEEGIGADFMIDVMEQRYAEKVMAGEKISGFGYYASLFRDKHRQRFKQSPSRGVDWEKVKRDLEEYERGSKSTA